MESASKKDLDGLGARVTEMDKSFATCQAERKEQILNLKEGQKEMKQNIETIFDKMDGLEVKVSSMSTKITVSIGIVVFIIQVALKFI